MPAFVSNVWVYVKIDSSIEFSSKSYQKDAEINSA